MSWFPKFRKTELEPIDFSVLRTDVHSHLIPSIDDGSQTVDESLDLVLALQDMGFSNIITTPHIMSDCYPNNPEIIQSGLLDLKKKLKQNNIQVEISAAAEYYVDFEFQKQIEDQKFLVFGENYILIELPFISPPNDLKDIIFNLQLNGYNVILAHPERYVYYKLKDFEELKQRGVLFQVNLLSLIGYYSPQVKKISEILINKGFIDFAGTDCHNYRHIEILKNCFTDPNWHKLVESGKLKNSYL